MGRHRKFDEREVLERALELFWQVGYAACSLDMLTARIGIARPSLYMFFGTKAQLFKKCFRYYERTEGAFLWRALGNASASEYAHLFMQGVIDAACDQRHPKGFFLSLCMIDDYHQCPDLKDFVLSRRHFHERMVARRLMRNPVAGDGTADPHFLAAMLFMLADGLSVAARVGHSRAALQRCGNTALARIIDPTIAVPISALGG